MTADTLVGRVQELGMGRMWSCWGQVGSYRILHLEMLVGSPQCPQCWLWGEVGCHRCLVWCGVGWPGAPGAGWGWPVPCNNHTVPLCQLIGFRPLPMEDRENARLPTQEGKRKMRNEWGCEPWFPQVLNHVSSADVEVTAAAPNSAISLCCH